MNSDYYLVVVYHRGKSLPLLSARYYHDPAIIRTTIEGKCFADDEGKRAWHDFNWQDESNLFLADRLSGNMGNMIYKTCRNFIFYRFYVEMVLRNPDSAMILMARSERHERLLTKYLRLGLSIRGYSVLHGRGHWVLVGDWSSMYRGKVDEVIRGILLILRLSITAIRGWKS